MNKSKRGFTLVELLVVITILGILMALLMPAVQSARESARVTECNNHLKQMSLACLTIESETGALPGGGWCCFWVGDPEGGQGMKQPGGWLYGILPYIGLNNLFMLPADGQQPEVSGNYHQANDTTHYRGVYQMEKTPVPLFNCPTRRRPLLYPSLAQTGNNPYYRNYYMPNPNETIGKTDYAGNCGWYYNPSVNGVGDNGSENRGIIKGTVPQGQGYRCEDIAQYRRDNSWSQTIVAQINGKNNNCNTAPTRFKEYAHGVLFRHSEILIDEISDGTSNTYLLGEKFLENDCYTSPVFTNQVGETDFDDNPLYCGSDLDNLRVTYCGKYEERNNDIVFLNYRQDPDSLGSLQFSRAPCLPLRDNEHNNIVRELSKGLEKTSCMPNCFGSAHAGSLGMSLCDGSVHRVAYAIDMEVHHCKGDRHDGQIASAASLK